MEKQNGNTVLLRNVGNTVRDEMAIFFDDIILCDNYDENVKSLAPIY